MLRVVTPINDPTFSSRLISIERSPARKGRSWRRCHLPYLTDAAISESEEVANGIVVDYDADGPIVGVEILDAPKRTGNPDALSDLSFDVPGAA